VDQEARKAQDKPVLSAEGFQRLLAAAYILQTNAARRLSPIEASGTTFADGAIVQRRTHSVMVQEPQLSPSPNIWSASRRMVETLAIAAIFCMVVGASIHRLPALPGRTSLTPGKPEQENAPETARPQESFLAMAQQPVVARKPLPRPEYGADVKMWLGSPKKAGLDHPAH
jgi:hypothetical protein